MVCRVTTFAFEGVDAQPVDVQVQLTGGNPAFHIVGLPDKAVGESRERVRAAFASLGLALPPKRVIVNLAPADLPKEGSHYDLAIALAMLAIMGVIPPDELGKYAAIGELSLDGSLGETLGVLPAAMAAEAMNLSLICPEICGAEAAWAGGSVLGARSLIALINHFTGRDLIGPPKAGMLAEPPPGPDLRDVKGQEGAKRVLEIAAAGGHNLLFCGPPGSGKSMLAQRLPGLLPPLSARELLEVSQIHSIAGLLERGRLSRTRPFRAPHHSASMAALVGGGIKAKPGEVSLAHHGVLFLDELPEFSAQVLDSLRQPLEAGEAVVARANRHVRYPARFQLVAAMNPCRCGGGPGAAACRRGPKCAESYQARLSGPFLDRIDLYYDTPPVTAVDLALPPPTEGTAEAKVRVEAARAVQLERYEDETSDTRRPVNADAPLNELERFARPDESGAALLAGAADRLQLTARGYSRVLKVARTIADLDGATSVRRVHIAEALSYRQRPPGRGEGVSAEALAH
ncbi:MAG TPA: YifB family Mg chelatase-like AAA ATPase [Hyphomonas sp.]|nr:YifB family Mg chelatase-like AAA ATPase [Hyphomonas sp.]MCB9963106.1 YifB family Mg chelatase-like AAA ATPase [Hyphomonas sp.]MCC0017656.1 YifB family Mg chelatase-like AAA ATPase [Rhodobiaceae bacterium]HPE48223.1 YifB family Mg chelatase-like AAA ATPase [Hyphomonas sp.]